MTDVPPQIFDNKRRMAMRQRAIARGAAQSFLLGHMADELADRLAFVSRSFESVLVIGPITVFADQILAERKVMLTADILANEEALSYARHSFDLVISAGTLDSVNDLPGALIQIRQTLKPDGLFLGTLYGAGSLSTLKAAMVSADGAHARPHIHPQIDLRTIADLMTRAGFALPVADLDTLKVRYASWSTLVSDLRDASAGNILSGPRGYARHVPTALEAEWCMHCDSEGRVSETFNFLQLNGWAPSPAQPKPAKRGSATVSLANVLKQSKD
jgi:NADH dehydrogenase [ubiquinone] 1 alpha subcomplex assembly factor 5